MQFDILPLQQIIELIRISCYFTFGTRKLFFKKIHSRRKPCKYYTSRVLYIPFYPPNSPIFGAKPLPRRRFLQHYYRNASHKRDTTQNDKVKSLKFLERMTNIVIIFVLSTNATCCILLDKNKNIYATFLIIFVGEAVFMFQKIYLN